MWTRAHEPFQHGKVFVTDDGAETDPIWPLRRFTHSRLTQSNNDQRPHFEQIIARERRGDYLHRNRASSPHVTNEIKAALKRVSADVDVVIAEIGGTVGDIECCRSDDRQCATKGATILFLST
jgi:CTP synthase